MGRPRWLTVDIANFLLSPRAVILCNYPRLPVSEVDREGKRCGVRGGGGVMVCGTESGERVRGLRGGEEVEVNKKVWGLK